MNKENVLCYDIGGTKVLGALVDEDLNLLASQKIETNPEAGPDAFIQKLISLGESLTHKKCFKGIGIASAGPLDPVKGYLLSPTNLKSNQTSWRQVLLTQPLSKHFNVECYLENDAAAAAIAEWKTQHSLSSSVASMTLGTGVGIGAIVEGKLFRNRNSYHPELSHIKINSQDSQAPCGCGHFGCIEAYLSGNHFPNYWSKISSTEKLSAKDLVEKALQKDEKALQAFDHYSELLAMALNSLALIASPETVYFSGGFSAAFRLFESQTMKNLKKLLQDRRQGLDYLPQLKKSQLEETAGVIGAACVAFNGPNRF